MSTQHLEISFDCEFANFEIGQLVSQLQWSYQFFVTQEEGLAPASDRSSVVPQHVDC